MAFSAKAVIHEQSQQMDTVPVGNIIQDLWKLLKSAAGTGVYGTLADSDESEDFEDFLRKNKDNLSAVAGGAAGTAAESDEFKDFLRKNKDILSAVAGGAGTAAGYAQEASDHSTTPSTGASAKPIIYSDWTPAASYFGMDQGTAYSEHMANTAHQREVADLRAAGLNPVLGLGSGASGVSGHVATSGSSAQKSLNGDFIVDAIGATAAVVTAILTKNPAYGYLAGNAVNAVGDVITSSKK